MRIRANAVFADLGVTRGSEWVEVTGALTDDAETPLPDAPVEIPIPDSARGSALDCRSGMRAEEAPGVAVVRTGTSGSFCVRLPASAGVEGGEVRYSGDDLHGSATAKVPQESTTRKLRLEFEATSLVISLDAPTAVVNVTTQVVDPGGPSDPVRLVLSHRDSVDAKEVELGAAFVPPGGVAKFNVETRLLIRPGTGKLFVRFPGSGAITKAEGSVLVERRATAELSLAARPSEADPSAGVELLVGVRSAIGAVPDGWVESLAEGQPVGIGTVKDGAARVVATFSPPRGHPAVVMLRYVPASAGWTPSAPINVEIPIAPAGLGAFIPWVLAALGIAYWVVVRSWRRPRRAARVVRRDPDVPIGRAALDLLQRGALRSGWRGRAVDAHEGTPVPGARINVVVPAFDGEGVARSCVSGEDGAFSLGALDVPHVAGMRLTVIAPHHTPLTGPLPPEGVLAICLVSRRRTLLDRMVSWAARMGGPWARRAEPTPGEVVALAAREQWEEVAAWAAAVEQAAYGPIPPDEQRENELVAREPALRAKGVANDARNGRGNNER